MNEPDTRHALAGLILAGGKSRRMGRDKACIVVGGQTLLSRSLALARQFCDVVAISGRERDVAALPESDPAASSALWIPDDSPGLGPIGGIATGLARLRVPLLVLPCDLPLLQPALIRRLLEARVGRPEASLATTFRHPDTGFLEPLVAVYELPARPLLLRAIDQGVYALFKALPPDRWHTILLTDDENTSFLNVNLREDLVQLQRRTGPFEPGPPEQEDASCTALV